jgi:hypothetical protein
MSTATKPTVRILGTDCHLDFGHYKNGTVAIQATIGDESAEDFGEPFATLTINWEANWEGMQSYATAFPFPAVIIKNYSELEGVLRDLVAAGVLTDGPYLSGSNGGVSACLLTPEWQAIAKESFRTL